MNFLTRAVDTALDRTVIPGYSRIGSTIRRSFWAADAPPFEPVSDIVVTGASSGLGEATVLGLCQLGARVHMVGRSASRLATAADAIRSTFPAADLLINECDMSDLDAVRELGDQLGAHTPRGVVHCAGVMPTARIESAQGHESAYATHILGPTVLTVALRGCYAADARVVFVSSGGMYPNPLRDNDFEYRNGEYSGLTAYSRTKRMQVVIAEQLAERFSRNDDPVVHSMHPGWADTPGVTDSIPGFARIVGPILRTAADGADTIVWLMGSPEAGAVTGKFWHDRSIRPTHYPSWRTDSPQARIALWENVIQATNISV